MLFHNSFSTQKEMGKKGLRELRCFSSPTYSYGNHTEERAELPSGSWHSHSTRPFLETKHSSRVQKARQRMEAWKSSSGDHMWINQIWYTSKSYWTSVPVRAWETGGGGEAVCQVSAVPSFGNVFCSHPSSGSASFNDSLLVRKFSLHITLWFLSQSRAFPALLMGDPGDEPGSLAPGLCSNFKFEFSSCKFPY